MIKKSWRVGITLCACAILAAGLVTPAAADAPPLPQDDPFYQPPAGFAATAPGTILRSRPVTDAAFALLPQHVTAWQVLYRTTDTQDQPEATVTTVLEPAGATPSASRPLVAYQVAEDSPASQCAMSFQFRLGAGNQNSAAQMEILLIDAALEQGWAVTVPDYEGPQSAYVAGKQAGQAVLDAIRATEAFAPAGLDGVRTNVGIWGYSGGALASGWAAELQPSYAPELNIKGVAEGGLPVNPGHVLNRINGTEFSGVAMSGIAGLRQAFPELNQFVNQNLTAAGTTAFDTAAAQCNPQNTSQFSFTNVNNFFTVPDPLDMPGPQQVIDEDTLGQHTPTAPLFVYQSLNDEVVPPADVDAIVAQYCAAGANVTYQRDLLSEHITYAILGAPSALSWLGDRLNGVPLAPGCHTSTVVTSVLSVPALLTTVDPVLVGDLLGLLDQPIGASSVF